MSGGLEDEGGEGEPARQHHFGIKCEGCGVNPIVGPRRHPTSELGIVGLLPKFLADFLG